MKKYDCNKVLDFIHEQNRLCKSINCCNCPLEKFGCNIEGITQEQIDLVQKWSDEHPEPTRYEKFMKLIEGTEFEKGFHKYPLSSTYLASDETIAWWNDASEE